MSGDAVRPTSAPAGEDAVCAHWLALPHAAAEASPVAFRAAARAESPYRPWRYVTEPVRALLRDASASGDPDQVIAARGRVVAFFRAMEAEALAPRAERGPVPSDAPMPSG